MNSQQADEIQWILNFFTNDKSFSEQIKLIEKINKWDTFFRSKSSDQEFAGVKALGYIKDFVKPDELLNYEGRVKLGRLTNGNQADHGEIVHAVSRLGALCGTKVGSKRSVGWSDNTYDVTCEKCLSNIAKLKKE